MATTIPRAGPFQFGAPGRLLSQRVLDSSDARPIRQPVAGGCPGAGAPLRPPPRTHRGCNSVCNSGCNMPVRPAYPMPGSGQPATWENGAERSWRHDRRLPWVWGAARRLSCATWRRAAVLHPQSPAFSASVRNSRKRSTAQHTMQHLTPSACGTVVRRGGLAACRVKYAYRCRLYRRAADRFGGLVMWFGAPVIVDDMVSMPGAALLQSVASWRCCTASLAVLA